MRESSERILNFLHSIEQLKHELRHSWTSKGRQESVADHSWRVALMLIICAPYLDKKIDLLKALKLAILHDIGEAKIGDRHYLDIINDATEKETRSRLEMQAVNELTLLLGDEGNSIASLWAEFENKTSEEAKIVYFIDKLEVCVQHNEADISTWTREEIDTIWEYYDLLKINDSFLSLLKEAVESETIRKLKAQK